MSATGQHLPPYVIFPRVRMHDSLKKGAPNGTKFNCNPSGYMTSEIFPDWFDHFIENTNPSETNPALLIIDGHSSHKGLAFGEKALANFVDVIVLPPHCSHKMQPLDVAFMGPFKSYYASASENFMRKFPGKAITLYDVAELMGAAYLKAASAEVAENGFRKSGIWPFNRNVFSDEDFAPSEVTDQPEIRPTNQPVNPDQPAIATDQVEVTTVTLITVTKPLVLDGSTVQQIPMPSSISFPELTGNEVLDDNQDDANQIISVEPKSEASPNSSFTISPKDILPLPKMAAPRNAKRKRKAEQAVEITGENYLQSLATSEAAKTIKAIKKGRKTTKKRTKVQKKAEIFEDTLCDLCGATFSDSVDGQGWKKCHSCLMWFHTECGTNEDDLGCRFCN